LLVCDAYKITYRNEKIGHALGVFGPCITVFSPAALDISVGTVDDHSSEEDWVEPWKWTPKASNSAPGQGEKKVTCVMNFASFAI